MYLIAGVILLLLSISLVQTRSIKAYDNGTSEEIVNANACLYDSVSAIIERANKNAGKLNDDFTIVHGDIVVLGYKMQLHVLLRSASGPGAEMGMFMFLPSTLSNKCYPAWTGLVPKVHLYPIHIPRTSEEQYIDIISGKGCYSSVGRRAEKQFFSINNRTCVYYHTVQHELLHALGFHHEQSRSDRDKHVKILYENVKPGKAHNFDIEETNNLDTPYDYKSIMHYSRCAFSNDNKPTIIPIPDNNVSLGHATEMSRNDILRVNRLYCT